MTLALRTDALLDLQWVRDDTQNIKTTLREVQVTFETVHTHIFFFFFFKSWPLDKVFKNQKFP